MPLRDILTVTLGWVCGRDVVLGDIKGMFLHNSGLSPTRCISGTAGHCAYFLFLLTAAESLRARLLRKLFISLSPQS